MLGRYLFYLLLWIGIEELKSAMPSETLMKNRTASSPERLNACLCLFLLYSHSTCSVVGDIGHTATLWG